MNGTARRTMWAFITLCLESVLAAFPTISLYSEPLSTGISLEGVAIKTPDAFPGRDVDVPERWTSGLTDASWYSRLVEASTAAAALQGPGRTRASRSGNDLPYFGADRIGSVMTSAWTPADLSFASGTFYMDWTAYHGNGPLRLSPQRPGPYR